MTKLYLEVFEASSRASFHLFCCRGSIHSKEAASDHRGAIVAAYKVSVHREPRQERQNQRKHLPSAHMDALHFSKGKTLTSLQVSSVPYF